LFRPTVVNLFQVVLFYSVARCVSALMQTACAVAGVEQLRYRVYTYITCCYRRSTPTTSLCLFYAGWYPSMMFICRRFRGT